MNQIARITAPTTKAPGHWVLARLGKRVLRPGGLEATNYLLRSLAPTARDEIVEFAPGLGITARRLLSVRPKSYTAVERASEAAARLSRTLPLSGARVVNAPAQESGLDDGCCDVVLGEAMLTMQPTEVKRAIIGEAARLLRGGGRYGIHEIALLPDNIAPEVRQRIRAGMSKAIHHGVTPQTVTEWKALLHEAGFTNLEVRLVPFRLLEPGRLIADEGWLGALRFGLNLLRRPEARHRVCAMRRTFQQNAQHLTSIVITARKDA